MLGGENSSSCSASLLRRSDLDTLDDDDLLKPSSGYRCSRDDVPFGALTYVAWLETPDLVALRRDLLASPDNDETRDFGRSDFVLLSESGVLVPERVDFRREPVKSVSGGVGGRELLLDVDDFRSGAGESFCLGGLGFELRSVCSGVSGSDFLLTSSRLCTASLL